MKESESIEKAMKALELTTEDMKALMDDSKEIPESHLHNVCRVEKEDSCKYITMVLKGGVPTKVCAKKTKFKEKIDEFVKVRLMAATSDNCEGL